MDMQCCGDSTLSISTAGNHQTMGVRREADTGTGEIRPTMIKWRSSVPVGEARPLVLALRLTDGRLNCSTFALTKE